ncbi:MULTISPECIES: hypothetical protein [Sphingomonadales]|jgi:hypothetical protein|uniref:Uncharacterized protein n=2 Tax=Sphingomonadaceae TaxID=41297 RepID=T0GU31_9SPHN|nr:MULTISPECIES: hypothetical protein [Sphingomonadaceae]AMG72935.1 Uncharacterized protein SGRAN_0539 [Sphingopyxis granuli]EQB04177.1 hypothetical protein L485_05660 [Sphingobium baderi LL03]KMS63032.1 hypothetical protein V475_04185 [Sphingobium baderi LL03]
MEIIVTRSRIAGTLPHYAYRALVPADKVAAERRALTGTVVGPKHVGRLPCVRLAQLLAPDRYFTMAHAERAVLASRIAALGRRIETLIIQASFPEMTAAFTPIIFHLDADPGDAFNWIDIDDLTAAFDRLELRFANLTAFDLGLRPDDGRCAA